MGWWNKEGKKEGIKGSLIKMLPQWVTGALALRGKSGRQCKTSASEWPHLGGEATPTLVCLWWRAVSTSAHPTWQPRLAKLASVSRENPQWEKCVCWQWGLGGARSEVVRVKCRHNRICYIWYKGISECGFSGGSVVKSLLASAGDVRDLSSIPGSGRSRGAGNGNPLQYCCLESLMDRGAVWATVHGAAKSWTRLSAWARHPGALRQQKFTPVQFWRLKLRSQDVCRTVLTLKTLEKGPFLPLVRHSLACAQVFTWPPSLCACVFVLIPFFL